MLAGLADKYEVCIMCVLVPRIRPEDERSLHGVHITMRKADAARIFYVRICSCFVSYAMLPPLVFCRAVMETQFQHQFFAYNSGGAVRSSAPRPESGTRTRAGRCSRCTTTRTRRSRRRITTSASSTGKRVVLLFMSAADLSLHACVSVFQANVILQDSIHMHT